MFDVQAYFQTLEITPYLLEIYQQSKIKKIKSRDRCENVNTVMR